MRFVQQRPKMTREELKYEIDLRLCEIIPGDTRTGPDISILMKANVVLDEIMALIDEYM